MNVLVLDSTSKSITGVLSGAATTTNPDFVTSYADSTATTFVEGANDGAFNGTTPITIATAPGASTRRVIKDLTICNRDTVAATITLNYINGANTRQVWKETLQAGDTRTLEATFDANGNIRFVNGGVASLGTSAPLGNTGTAQDPIIALTGTVGLNQGGTEANMAATGPGFVKQASAGAAFSTGLITGSDLTSALATPPDIGTTTPAVGVFSSLKEKIGGYLATFTHSNSADRTYTLPNYDGTLTTLAGSESLSNKTITASTLVATAISLLLGGFKAIFTHSNTADRTYTLPDYNGTLATIAGTETLTGKTLTIPVIGDLTNAQHSHQSAAGGGSLDGAAIGSGTVLAARLGAMTGDSGTGGAKGAVPAPSAGDATANKFLHASGGWIVPLTPGEKVYMATTFV